jgi:hypothetical protein
MDAFKDVAEKRTFVGKLIHVITRWMSLGTEKRVASEPDIGQPRICNVDDKRRLSLPSLASLLRCLRLCSRLEEGAEAIALSEVGTRCCSPAESFSSVTLVCGMAFKSDWHCGGHLDDETARL